MKKTFFIFLTALLLLALTPVSQVFSYDSASSNFRIEKSSINFSGGDTASSDNYLIKDTLGEIISGISSGADEKAAAEVKRIMETQKYEDHVLRIGVAGGGCSGFQYGFTFDDQVNEGDMTIEKQGVGLVVDPMSLQYLVGGSVDYTEGLEGSRFIVTNPNAKSTCGCGSSFSI